jgi:cytochrome c oxidase subunit 4
MKPLATRTYVLVWAILLILLVATRVLARVDLHPLNAAIAMAIAFSKMLLILLFFMHLRYGSRLTWIFAAAGFIFIVILIELTLNDYLTR